MTASLQVGVGLLANPLQRRNLCLRQLSAQLAHCRAGRSQTVPSLSNKADLPLRQLEKLQSGISLPWKESTASQTNPATADRLVAWPCLELRFPSWLRNKPPELWAACTGSSTVCSPAALLLGLSVNFPPVPWLGRGFYFWLFSSQPITSQWSLSGRKWQHSNRTQMNLGLWLVGEFRIGSPWWPPWHSYLKFSWSQGSIQYIWIFIPRNISCFSCVNCHHAQTTAFYATVLTRTLVVWELNITTRLWSSSCQVKQSFTDATCMWNSPRVMNPCCNLGVHTPLGVEQSGHSDLGCVAPHWHVAPDNPQVSTSLFRENQQFA